MYNSKYSNRSSSISSAASGHQSPSNRFKSPVPADYEYLGRLVTRERQIIPKSKPIQQNLVFPQNKNKYHQLMRSQRREIHEDEPGPSSDDNTDEPDDINKPLGVIRISDRHFREIYRLPTPPPEVKRVYHRLRSPEPKIIERVFVRRPRPQIIENIIQVPPEKVRIINKEKYLEKPAPITRSKLVRLKSRHHQREEDAQSQQKDTFIPFEQGTQQQMFIPTEQHSQQQMFIPSEQQSQQQMFIPSEQQSQQQMFIPSEQQSQQQMFIPIEQQSQQQMFIPSEQHSQQKATTVPLTTPQPSPATTTLVYPPQPNMRTVGYIKSHIPPNVMFNSQNPLQVSAQQISNQQMVQPTPFNHPPQQTTNYQMVQPASYTYPQQQPINHQMVQPTPYYHPPQQPINQQMVQPTLHNHLLPQTTNYQMVQPTSYTYPQQQPFNRQMGQPTPYPYPSQQTIPNSFHGY